MAGHGVSHSRIPATPQQQREAQAKASQQSSNAILDVLKAGH